MIHFASYTIYELTPTAAKMRKPICNIEKSLIFAENDIKKSMVRTPHAGAAEKMTARICVH